METLKNGLIKLIESLYNESFTHAPKTKDVISYKYISGWKVSDLVAYMNRKNIPLDKAKINGFINSEDDESNEPYAMIEFPCIEPTTDEEIKTEARRWFRGCIHAKINYYLLNFGYYLYDRQVNIWTYSEDQNFNRLADILIERLYEIE